MLSIISIVSELSLLHLLVWKWGIKMDSEKWQRIQKKELIGKNLEAEDLPLEHKQRKDNKNMTIIKKTACGYVHNLKEKVISYIEDLSK